MKYFPLGPNEESNQYYLRLLANRTITDAESELGLAIAYAKEHATDCFEWPRDIEFCAKEQRKILAEVQA
jgi:hypothetical protein